VRAPINASPPPSRALAHDSGSSWSLRLFHPFLLAGLSQRTGGPANLHRKKQRDFHARPRGMKATAVTIPWRSGVHGVCGSPPSRPTSSDRHGSGLEPRSGRPDLRAKELHQRSGGVTQRLASFTSGEFGCAVKGLPEAPGEVAGFARCFGPSER